ncbi:MAG: hypothetical protein Q9169_007709, partial [Polycauliona sp. 2 TL-2023]
MDPATAAAIAAVAIALLAFLVAFAQVLQQYLMTGSLLRLCDKTVYGKLPGRGRRIWQADQFRFRVVYTLPQLRLDPELWDEKRSDLHSYPNPEDWNKWTTPRKGLLGAIFERLLVNLRRTRRRRKSKSLLFEPTGARSGEASWASFTRVVQDNCRKSLRFDVAEGDADRCPSDLPNVPMQVSLRDVVIMGLMIGMSTGNVRDAYREVEMSQLSMIGSAGHITFSRHSILGTILHFTPSKVDSLLGFRDQLTQTINKLWLLRIKGSIPVAGRAYDMNDKEYLDAIDSSWIPATGDFRPGLRRDRPVVIPRSSQEHHSDRTNTRRKHSTPSQQYTPAGAQSHIPPSDLSASPASRFGHVRGSRKAYGPSVDSMPTTDGLDQLLGQSAAYEKRKNRLSSDSYPDDGGNQHQLPDAPFTINGSIIEVVNQKPQGYDLNHAEDNTAMVSHNTVHVSKGQHEISGSGTNDESTQLNTTYPNKSSERPGRNRSLPTNPRYNTSEVRPSPAGKKKMADEDHASKEPTNPTHAMDEDTTTKPKGTRQNADPQERERPQYGSETWPHQGHTRQTWKWTCQMDVMPALWATPWYEDINYSKGAISTILEALSSLLGTEALQYVSSLRDKNLDKIFDHMYKGYSTWPIYAINARDGFYLQDYAPEVELPGIAVKMPAIRVLYNYEWQTKKYLQRGQEDSKVAELMMIDSWLSICGRQSEITNGASDLRRNMPKLVQYLFEKFELKFARLHLSANEGGLQHIRPVAQKLMQRLADGRLSPAEQLFTLVAMLRTAKIDICIATGPFTSHLLDVLDTETRGQKQSTADSKPAVSPPSSVSSAFPKRVKSGDLKPAKAAGNIDVSLLDVGWAGFETLSKPFTGQKEVEWEAMASRMQESNERRRKSDASASCEYDSVFPKIELPSYRELDTIIREALSRHKYENATTFRATAPPPNSSYSYTRSIKSECTGSIQNSYHRMVTEIEAYTLTSGEKAWPIIQFGETHTQFTLTGPTSYVTTVTHALRPGRPWQAYYPADYCCMDCYVYFPQVEVFYWPIPKSEATCANDSKPLVTAQAVLPSGAAKTAEAHYNALYSNISITGVVSTVIDSFTFVSPSVYVAFGDVSAGDACGAVGQKHTSVTLGFAPGVLQTVTGKVSPPLGKDHYDTTLGTRAFDPANVLCPLDYEPETLFVEQDRLAGISTYRPRIEIPEALQNLDPAWKRCVVDSYEGIDPPHALVPASGFEDDPGAITSVAPVQQPTPAAVVPSLPKETGNGGGGDPGILPSSPLVDPPASVFDNPPNEGSSDPLGDKDPQQPDHQSLAVSNPDQGGPAQGGSEGDAGPDPSQQQDLQQPNVPGTSGSDEIGGKPAQDNPVENSRPSTASDPVDQPADLTQQQPNPQSVQPAIVVGGQTIKQGAAPVVIDGKPVIYSQGFVHVGEAVAPAPVSNARRPSNPLPRPQAVPVQLGGFEFAPVIHQEDPNKAPRPGKGKPAVVVQGQTIKQGGPPVTINGNKVTYTGGVVQVGNEIVPIPPPRPGEVSKPVVAQGLTFTPTVIPPKATDQDSPNSGQGRPNNNNNDLTLPNNNPDQQPPRPAILIKGQIISENGPPATINGKPLVYSGGAVFAAGTKVVVPTLVPGQPPANPINIAGMSFVPQPITSNDNKSEKKGVAPAVIVAGQILTENAPAITVNGATLAYAGGS